MFGSLAMASLVVYRGALLGPFISDDFLYIVLHPSVRSPDPQSLAALFRIGGNAEVANYAPVHLLLHAIEWQLFGPRVAGYHMANVLVHALNATLLIALLITTRIPRSWAVLGGAFFAFHPANVEAVAWIS